MTQRTRVDCDRCGKPNSALEALFHWTPGVWNYRVCPGCARQLKRKHRNVKSIPAPLLSTGTPGTDHLCWGPREWDYWHELMEREKKLDDLMFDRMAMDRG